MRYPTSSPVLPASAVRPLAPSTRRGWVQGRATPRGARLHAALSAAIISVAALVAPGEARAHDEVIPPQPISQAAPDWPGGAPHSHDVVVPLLLVIGTDGAVRSAEVEVSVSQDLDAAALRAAQGWKFSPATRNGAPVEARIRAVARFPGVPAVILAPEPGAPAAHDGDHRQAQPARGIAADPPPPAADHAHPAHAHAGHAAPHTHGKPVNVTVQGVAPARSASEVVRDGKVLQAAPHRTASDLLAVVPGVFVTQHSGEGKAHQIFLRGFDAVHGQDMEIWVGGAPVNEVSNIHGQGYADLHFVMPEVVREIHATPGTFDPRQGDFAVAGSVRMRLGWDEPGFTAKGTLGSFGTRRLFAAYHPEGQPDSTFAAAETQSTDGFGPARAAQRSALVAQGVYDLGGGISGRLLATTYAARFGSAGVLRLRDVESGAVDAYDTYDPSQGGSSSRTQLVIDVRRSDDDSTLALAPYFILRNLRLRQNYTGFLQDPIAGDATQQLNESVTVGTTGFYRKKVSLLSDRDAFELGISARNDWITQSQRRLSAVDDSVTATFVDAEVRATDIGAYADATLHPVRRLVLRGGGRVDGLSYSTVELGDGGGQARTALGAHVGAKGTADLAVLPGLHALVSAGQGFRSPQARSLGDGEQTPFTTVTSYEAGVRYGDGDRLQASAAGFYTTLSDDLAFDETTGRNEPVPATERLGVALDLVAKPRPWLTAAFGATWTRASFTESNARFVEGDLLPYVPQLVARSDLSFTPTLARLGGHDLKGELGFAATLLHERPLPFGETGHDVFTVDAKAGARWRWVGLELDVYNVLDADHYDGEFVYASAFGGSPSLVPERHITMGPPIGFFLSLSLFLS